MYDSHEFLAHYGVKGMQWGVRRDRRAARLASLGTGDGGVASKARSIRDYGIVDTVRGRGLRGGARIRGNRQLARNQRVKNGEASVRDKIAYYGGTRAVDLIPVRTKNATKTTTEGRTQGRSSRNEKLLVGAAGAYFVGKMLVNAAKNAQVREIITTRD